MKRTIFQSLRVPDFFDSEKKLIKYIITQANQLFIEFHNWVRKNYNCAKIDIYFQSIRGGYYIQNQTTYRILEYKKSLR